MAGRGTFEDFVRTLDYLEVLRVVVLPDSKFSCPSEEGGRITEIRASTRHRLAAFLRELADRLDHPELHPPKGPK